ncbi:YBR187W [Saccharomyces arboricola H-6]|uniref:GDT1 family protein n=1 Tax=Saccharomyces arboricola (strain H-6 / AS 2.3317 / CBS 10644) TaxID=1160507 RepID=J8Q4V7_SACAR|nr:YBR187W [Saccharomyces arboricola H-6]
MRNMIKKASLFALLPLFAAAAATSATAATTAADAGTPGEIEISSHSKSFLMSITMIGLSEIGDKTFLIAALMAMRHRRILVFSAAATSLAIMTILSGVVGHSVVAFLSERYTSFLAGILFLVFGYKLTMEGLEMSKDAGVQEEMAEVEEEISVKDINKGMNDVEKGGEVVREKHLKNASTGTKIVHRIRELASFMFSPAWVQIFLMVFLGELGDRSQISIIAMATDSDYWFVIAGAVVGHAICSALAVIGGKLLATRISIRTITLASSLLFFIFALMYIYEAFTISD